MDKKLLKVVIAVVILGIASISIWYVMTPHNYEDCILKNLKSNSTESVAEQIKTACEIKFLLNDSASSCKYRELTDREKSLVTAKKAYIDNIGYIVVGIHNGNENISISNLIVQIWNDEISPPQKYSTFVVGTGNSVSSLRAGEVSAKLAQVPTKAWNWSIVSMQTCQ